VRTDQASVASLRYYSYIPLIAPFHDLAHLFGRSGFQHTF
jgi:hypothetical protein